MTATTSPPLPFSSTGMIGKASAPGGRGIDGEVATRDVTVAPFSPSSVDLFPLWDDVKAMIGGVAASSVASDQRRNDFGSGGDEEEKDEGDALHDGWSSSSRSLLLLQGVMDREEQGQGSSSSSSSSSSSTTMTMMINHQHQQHQQHHQHHCNQPRDDRHMVGLRLSRGERRIVTLRADCTNGTSPGSFAAHGPSPSPGAVGDYRVTIHQYEECVNTAGVVPPIPQRTDRRQRGGVTARGSSGSAVATASSGVTVAIKKRSFVCRDFDGPLKAPLASSISPSSSSLSSSGPGKGHNSNNNSSSNNNNNNSSSNNHDGELMCCRLISCNCDSSNSSKAVGPNTTQSVMLAQGQGLLFPLTLTLELIDLSPHLNTTGKY